MSSRLKRFWDIPTLWPICFSILFGYDVAEINFEKNFEFSNLLETFGKRKVMYPESLMVITTMLQQGFKDVMRYQEDPDSPAAPAAPFESIAKSLANQETRPRTSSNSMDLATALESRCMYPLFFDANFR